MAELREEGSKNAIRSIAIEIQDVFKTFPGSPSAVFAGIDLKIPEGEIAYLLGPSGSGKSVMLKHIVGLMRPDRGVVRIFGKHIPYDSSRRLNELRKRFGVLFQGAALFDNMTVFQNVAFPLMAHRKHLSSEEIRDKVLSKLEAVGLSGEASIGKYPNELSGGMRKRVALARAIILEPQILLYDEPTTGLDPINRTMVEDLIIRTNHAYRLTSLVITHDVFGALFGADKIAFLYQGKIVFWGTSKEFERSTQPMIQKYLQAEERHRTEARA